MQIARIGGSHTRLYSADVVGAKAANIARMAALGLPVPPAFVLPVKLGAAILAGDADGERSLLAGLAEGISYLEETTGRRFGDRRRPLLVSVRSGAAQSMPGMMDTVLDLGCTLTAVRGLVRMTGNPRFAWDCRRRLLEGYAGVVLGLDPKPFDACLAQRLAHEGVTTDRDLDTDAWQHVAADYQTLVDAHAERLPDDPMVQLVAATRAVYRSWLSPRAVSYRQIQKLQHLEGTAVTVQAMVFGNRGLTSGAGVAFSRDPSTGDRQPIIDVIFDAQGEDVVSGRRTPDTAETIAQSLPAVATELRAVLAQLERAFGDVQDVEFTIEDGKLWILQTRSAKRTPRAALRIAIDLVEEGLITSQEAMRRVDGLDVTALGRARFVDPGDAVACGIGASDGVAVGRAAFNSTSAERLAAHNDPVILFRPETTTADIAGFAAASGIVTAVGGRTAHAALVARQMGTPCVVGCAAILVDVTVHRARVGEVVIEEGDWVSVDGGSGCVYLGRRDVVVERPDAALALVARWRSAGAAVRGEALQE